MLPEQNRFEVWRVLAVALISVAFVAAAVVLADDEPAQTQPGVIFVAPLPDAPGKQLVVVELNLPPKEAPETTPDRRPRGHRHPGSVYVHVMDGAMRLGLQGEPVQIVREGGSFFEPPGALHTVMENVSSSEPARAIAVMIVPEGAPLVAVDSEPRP